MFLAVTLGGMLRSRHTDTAERPAVQRPGLRSVLLLPVDHGILCLLFLLWAWPVAFRFGYAGLLIAHFVFLVTFTATVYHELARTRPDQRSPRAMRRPERSSP